MILKWHVSDGRMVEIGLNGGLLMA